MAVTVGERGDMAERETIQFRPGKLREQFAARAGSLSIDLVAKRDLERYYALIGQQPQFSPGEACLLADAMNGVHEEPWSINVFWAGVQDAIDLEHLDEKWKVDGKELVARLRALSAGEKYAVVDAVERAWAIWRTEPDADTVKTLKLVGLIG